jgi:hypothetical protein
MMQPVMKKQMKNASPNDMPMMSGVCVSLLLLVGFQPVGN